MVFKSAVLPSDGCNWTIRDSRITVPVIALLYISLQFLLVQPRSSKRSVLTNRWFSPSREISFRSINLPSLFHSLPLISIAEPWMPYPTAFWAMLKQTYVLPHPVLPATKTTWPSDDSNGLKYSGNLDCHSKPSSNPFVPTKPFALYGINAARFSSLINIVLHRFTPLV